MGIIEQQATKNAIYSYLGAGLGFFTVLWMSHTLTTDENGLIRILVSIAALLAQVSGLGFSSVTIRLFPYFRNQEKGHHGFLYYAIIVSIVGFLLCWLGFYFFKSMIIESNSEKSKLFVDYLFYLMPLSFFTLFFTVFDTYLRACYSSVIGSFSKDFFQRIIIIIVLALYFFQFINFSLFILGYIIACSLPTILLLSYIIKLKEWHVRPVKGFVTQKLANEMIKLSTFSLLAGFSGTIIINIDTIMVNQMLGLSETGIYGIAFFFGSIMLIPARSINRITTSIVAECMKMNDFTQIKKLYNQTCNTGIAVGNILFIGICININNIMLLLPPEYASGKYVILFIGAGYIAEMSTGINQVILANSKYYYYDGFFVLFIVVITVAANYLLIPIYGIMGSAIATAITITLGNIMRWGFLLYKYKMQPYDFNSVKLVIISVVTFLIGYFIPISSNFIVDIAIRSLSAGGLFALLILKTEATPDINKKIRKNLKRFSINL
ncbi:MAG: oligosaccharide flippase family protein [Bacteroidota bacterium]